jgi:hypothetical protein
MLAGYWGAYIFGDWPDVRLDYEHMKPRLLLFAISSFVISFAAPALAQQSSAPAKPGVTPTVPPPAALQTDVIAPPPAGKAQVVFYRPRELYAMTRPCLIYESGSVAARIGNGKYTIRTYEPGTYPFNATAETYGIDEVGRALINVELLAGGTVYLKCFMKMGNTSAYSAFVPTYKVSFDDIARRLSRAN